MTTGQTMLAHRSPAQRALRALMLLCACALAACAPKPTLITPSVIVSPYSSAQGDVLWGVVPLRNESGAAPLDPLAISDKVVAAAAQIRGVRVVPLNRTIAAMRAMQMNAITSPDQIRQLAAEMGVDALIVGSITAYDPYNPPTLGLSLAIYKRPGAMDLGGGDPIDPRTLQYQPTDYKYLPASTHEGAPASVIAVYFDGKNHQTLADVQTYAHGRHDPRSALGWKRYLASMDLFTEFAAWHAVKRLIDHEWIRLSRTPAGPKS